MFSGNEILRWRLTCNMLDQRVLSGQREKLSCGRAPTRPQPKPWRSMELGRPFRVDHIGEKEPKSPHRLVIGC